MRPTGSASALRNRRNCRNRRNHRRARARRAPSLVRVPRPAATVTTPPAALKSLRNCVGVPGAAARAGRGAPVAPGAYVTRAGGRAAMNDNELFTDAMAHIRGICSDLKMLVDHREWSRGTVRLPATSPACGRLAAAGPDRRR